MSKYFLNWDFKRILFLIAGWWMIAQAVFDKVWWMAIIGIYFLSMAIFKFGCTSGNCAISNDKIEKEN